MHPLITGVPMQRGLLFATFIVLLMGCSEPAPATDEDDEPALPDNWCISDGECDSDEICRFGICGLDTSVTSLDYGLLITPRHRGDVPRQQLDVASRALTGAEVDVSAFQVIAGEVITADGDPAPNGTLVVEPVSPSNPSSAQPPVRDGDFEMHVAAGEYRLQYLVDDDRWPELHFDAQEIIDPADGLALEIPELGDLPVVSGTLTRDVSDLVDILTEPVEGAEIIAVGANTGYRSTLARTDDEGEFELRLPPGDDTFDVLVAPGDDTDLIPYASFAEEITAGTDDISISIGEFELELLTAAAEVSVESVDGHTPDWEDYRVNFRRSVDLGELLVSPSLDDTGGAEVDLLPGSYEVEVITPDGAPWGPASEQVDLLDGLTSLDIELPLRTLVEGTVVDPAGQPVEDVRILVKSTDDSATAAPAVFSDDQGEFQLWLGAGDFLAYMRPPAAIGLPPFVESFSVDTADDVHTLSAQFPRPVVATGFLDTTDGQPITQARLRAFVPDAPDRIVGEGLTNSDGFFHIVFSADIVDP